MQPVYSPQWRYSLGLLLCLLGTACTREKVASVNGVPISRTLFEQALRIELMKYDPIVWRDRGRQAAVKQEVLSQLIEETMLAREAKKAGVRPSEEEWAEAVNEYKGRYTEAGFQEMLRVRGIEYEAWKTLRRQRYLIDRHMVQQEADNTAIDQASVERYYREHKAEFTEAEAVQVRQIVTDSEVGAREIREQILKGANFAQLAMERSLTPDAAEGGDLGFIPRGSFPRVFEEVCFRLPVGAMSDVVQSEYGYHLFKIVARRPARALTLTEARSQIVARLRQEANRERYEQWVEDLRKSAKVVIYKDVVADVVIKEPPHGP